jgi:hypothetical protein
VVVAGFDKGAQIAQWVCTLDLSLQQTLGGLVMLNSELIDHHNHLSTLIDTKLPIFMYAAERSEKYSFYDIQALIMKYNLDRSKYFSMFLNSH